MRLETLLTTVFCFCQVPAGISSHSDNVALWFLIQIELNAALGEFCSCKLFSVMVCFLCYAMCETDAEIVL